MSFNGSGVFQRLYSWVNDAAGGIKIRADRMDNEMNGMATALSTCITKDGQTTITANLPMAGFRHTGVGNGSARTDYASLGQVQDGNSNWVDGGGTADAITATYSPSITALIDGQLCFVRATAANATTAPTFSPSALTARTIVKNGGVALAVGDISGDGHQLILRYDLANTRWELLNPKSSIPFTAASSSGPASLAFAEDTDNGTNTATIIAPASIASDTVHTLPAATGTLLSTAAAVSVVQGGTGLASLTLNGVMIGQGTSAPAFVAPSTSGNVLTSNGTTWVSSAPAAGASKAISSDYAITSSGTQTFTHGLGAIPAAIKYELVCTSNDNGFTTGQVVDALCCMNPQVERGFIPAISSTTIVIRFGSAASVFQSTPAGGGSATALDNTKWTFRITATKV